MKNFNTPTTGFKKQPIRKNSLVGTLYTNNDGSKKPGVLLLSGSEGGIPGKNAIPEQFIEYIVKSGFVVFALAYFGVDNLPTNLENIPLEYFESAIELLKSHPQVDFSNLGIIGQSRGGELALLLGSYFPHLFQAIIACAPCNMICGGFPFPNRPSWTYLTKPLAPYLSGLSNSDNDLSEARDLKIAVDTKKIPYHESNAEDPYIISDLFIVRQRMAYAQAQIAVERIECPLLLISGDNDTIWPSKLFCELIVKHLDDHQWEFPKEHINYTDAGHGILSSYDGSIYHPVGEFWCKLGGTPNGNMIANEHSWFSIKKFLEKSIKHER